MISNDKNDKAGQSSKVTVEYVMESKSLKITWEAPTTSQAVSSIVFPVVCSQCTCTARVTVVVLCVCLSVCTQAILAVRAITSKNQRHYSTC